MSTQSFQLSPLERLELARTLATVLTEQGLVAQLNPVAVTQPTAARLLDCSVKQISNLRKRGDLTTVIVGDTPHVSMASIRALDTKNGGINV